MYKISCLRIQHLILIIHEWYKLIQLLNKFLTHINIKFDLDECKMIDLKRGFALEMVRFTIPEKQDIESMEENEVYN